MGAKLIKRAYIYAIDVPLTPNEFRLLNWMALTALDEDVTPRYFDSQESSALALGRRVLDAGCGDEHDQLERAAALQAVKVATAGLVKLRAVTRIKDGRTGQRAEYAIHLDVAITRTTTEWVKRASKGRPALPSKVGPPYDQSRPALPDKVGPAYPQGTTTGTTGTTPGITPANASTSLGAVENFA